MSGFSPNGGQQPAPRDPLFTAEFTPTLRGVAVVDHPILDGDGVQLQLGGPELGLKVNLSPDDAEALAEQLTGAAKIARSKVRPATEEEAAQIARAQRATEAIRQRE